MTPFLEKVLNNEEVRNAVSKRDDVVNRFGPLFRNPSKLTKQDYLDFLDIKHNHHWSHLYRKGKPAAEDMDNLRNAITLLIDESLPLAERYDAAKRMLPGVGKATATPMLLLAHPDRYGVWNGISEKELKKHRVWPTFSPGLSEGEKYAIINDILLNISQELGVDLWTLDSCWWVTNKNPGYLLFHSLEGKPSIDLPPAGEEIPHGREGAEVQVTSSQYERDPKLRRACVEYFVRQDGQLKCQVCDLDFSQRYGEIGRGFIHIHHKDPLGEGQGEREVDPIRDLVPVCPNCHAMLHKKSGKGAYTVKELKKMMEQQRANLEA